MILGLKKVIEGYFFLEEWFLIRGCLFITGREVMIENSFGC